DQKELITAAREGRAMDERWHVRRDGSCFFALGVMTALRDESGELRGFAKVLRDFTARKLAEHERQLLLEREREARKLAEEAQYTAESAQQVAEEAQEKAELALQAATESDRAKDDFIAVISHELRTPINLVQGWVSILKTGGLDAETTARALDTIERNSQSQARLINDLLDVSRIREGKLEIVIEPVDVIPLVEAAIDEIRPEAEIKAIEVRTSFKTPLAPVPADSGRLQQIVTNLLSNAVKFTPQNGHIEIKVAQRDERAVICVHDSGIGIAPHFLPHVFGRFRQGSRGDRRMQGGLGLGLSIVEHLVEMHGGDISAHSEGEGKGATFTVELPLGHATGS
ncbi:MAG TPA: ATP-binding protein, partial [Abditibacteriaceae bacterium]